MRNETTPRAWVGSLAAYNAGRLLGDWFDAGEIPTTAEEWVDAMADRGLVQSQAKLPEVRAKLAETHEELWVFDHEGFHGLLKGECSPMEAASLAELIEEIEAEPVEIEAVVAWAEHEGRDLDEWDAPTREAFLEAWQGEWDTELDFGYETADDLVLGSADIPDVAKSYFDYAKFTRDLFMGDHYSTSAPAGGVYVFRSI